MNAVKNSSSFLISPSSLPPSLVLNEWFRICIHKLSVQWLALSGPRWRKFSFHCTSSAQTGALFSSTVVLTLCCQPGEEMNAILFLCVVVKLDQGRIPCISGLLRCTGVTTYHCCEQAVPWALLKKQMLQYGGRGEELQVLDKYWVLCLKFI